MPSQFHFVDLTPDLQLDALQSIGVYAESGLLALNSYENRVYQFKANDNRRYVVKFYRPERWSDAQILEEHQFALDLQQADVPMVAPIERDGQTLHHFQHHRFALFPSQGGRALEMDNLDHYEQLGHYLGMLHQVGAQRSFQARPRLELQRDVERASAQLLASPFLPVSLRAAYEQLLASSVALLPTEPLRMLRCHGDCHVGNLLMHDGLTLLDLDDSIQAPAITDFYLLLSGERDEQRLQLDVLLESYQNFSQLQGSELAWLEALRWRRMLSHMAWLDQRWADAAFPKAFPWFEQPSFWQQQLKALEQQWQALQGPALSLTPYY